MRHRRVLPRRRLCSQRRCHLPRWFGDDLSGLVVAAGGVRTSRSRWRRPSIHSSYCPASTAQPARDQVGRPHHAITVGYVEHFRDQIAREDTSSCRPVWTGRRRLLCRLRRNDGRLPTSIPTQFAHESPPSVVPVVESHCLTITSAHHYQRSVRESQ